MTRTDQLLCQTTYTEMSPPVRKAMLKISTPRKAKIGDTITITAEIYSYVYFVLLDISDTLIKNVARSKSQEKYTITLAASSGSCQAVLECSHVP